VLRGGSWGSNREVARADFRSYDLPGFRDFTVGFRVVCSSPIR
jgi:formylglycine-generating enzyme required for sulfatase activity